MLNTKPPTKKGDCFRTKSTFFVFLKSADRQVPTLHDFPY